MQRSQGSNRHGAFEKQTLYMLLSKNGMKLKFRQGLNQAGSEMAS